FKFFLDGLNLTDAAKFFFNELVQQTLAIGLKLFPSLLFPVGKPYLFQLAPCAKKEIDRVAFLIEKVSQRLMNDLAEYQARGRKFEPKILNIIEAILFRASEISVDA